MRIVDLARRSVVPVGLSALAIFVVVQARTGAGLRPTAERRSPAPELVLPDLQGHPVSLASLRGRPVLLNFFATWCPPCLAELPELQALAQAQPDCLLVLGISQGTEGARELAAFAKERGVTYPLLLDDGGAGASYSVSSIPRSVLIDADGNIAGIADGTVTKAGVEKAVRAIAKAPPRC
jgi:peroxiredoxin